MNILNIELIETIESHQVDISSNLAEKLRDRIYQRVVPLLAQGIVQERGLKKPNTKDLTDTYEMTMVLLLRLLFINWRDRL